MLVPLMVRTPPPGDADLMSWPGAHTLGRLFENEAIVYPSAALARAPVESTPSAAAGKEAAIS